MSNQCAKSLVNAPGANHSNFMEMPRLTRRSGKSYGAVQAVVALAFDPASIDSHEFISIHGMERIASRYLSARMALAAAALKQAMEPGTPPPGGTPLPPETGPAVISHSPFSPTFHPLYAARP